MQTSPIIGIHQSILNLNYENYLRIYSKKRNVFLIFQDLIQVLHLKLRFSLFILHYKKFLFLDFAQLKKVFAEYLNGSIILFISPCFFLLNC